MNLQIINHYIPHIPPTTNSLYSTIPKLKVPTSTETVMAKRKAQEKDNAKIPKISSSNISEEFLIIADNLNSSLEKIKFIKDIPYVYNPTRYAYMNYESYVTNYCNTTKQVMFLGMNPGPWGMSQTGVPFGEVDTVKNWLKIEGAVNKPEKELSTRPIQGLNCQKTEVSGKRFWGLMKELCQEVEVFFKHCFVYNYLPLQFITSTGKNLPPTCLKPNEQDKLFEVCDEAFINVIKLYEVKVIVAIGKFAETRAKTVIKKYNLEDIIKVVCILHPSPQSKAANNWRVDAYKQLEEFGITEYLCN